VRYIIHETMFVCQTCERPFSRRPTAPIADTRLRRDAAVAALVSPPPGGLTFATNFTLPLPLRTGRTHPLPARPTRHPSQDPVRLFETRPAPRSRRSWRSPPSCGLVSTVWRHRYVADLARNRKPARSVEYSVSSSLMTLLIAHHHEEGRWRRVAADHLRMPSPGSFAEWRSPSSCSPQTGARRPPHPNSPTAS
jgi:hypothetical protein